MTISLGALGIGARRRTLPAADVLRSARRPARPTETAASEASAGLRATWVLVRQSDGSVRPEMSWASRAR